MDLTVDGDKKLANRFTLFIPNHLGKDEQRAAARPPARPRRDLGYHGGCLCVGRALRARHRVRAPPPAADHAHVTAAQPAAGQRASRELERDARGAALPGDGDRLPVHAQHREAAQRGRGVRAYAAWIADVVVPRARKEAPVIADAAHTALDGVSLGGQVGVEVFVRRPEVFGVYGARAGGVQHR